jgi:tetratricopeptide (TPR) repeat protein
MLMDRQSDAIPLLEEAIGILRPLASSNPAVHAGLLSQALSQLGVCLLNEDRVRAGKEALQEAVEIFSVLPERSGIVGIEPNFVGMLCNLGMALTSDGQADAALSVLVDAVEQARILAAADPYHARFLPWALHNSAMALMALGRWEAALPVSEEAEQLFRELASAEPENYAERWDKTRGALAYILDALDRREEASALRSMEL